jgi:hypothetical protein
MPQVTRISNKLILLEKGKILAGGSNISSIISQYHNLSKGESVIIEEGSGKIKIHEVLIQNHQGVPVEKLHYGEKFSVFVCFSFVTDECFNQSLRILITIADGEGNNIAQIYELLKFTKYSAQNRVSLTFEKALFSSGKYSLTVSTLVGERGELACVKRNIKTLLVENETVAYAPIILMPETIECN